VLPEDLVIDALGVLAFQAVLASSARDPGIHDDPVPDLEVRDVRPDLGDVPRRIGAEDVRQCELEGRDAFPHE